MNEVKQRIRALEEKGWTLASIADELGSTADAVQKWKAEDRIPSNLKSILEQMDMLLLRRQVPRKRRHKRGERPRRTDTAA